MADSVIKMPTIKGKLFGDEPSEDIVSKIQEVYAEQAPKNGTEVYEVLQVNSVPSRLKTVTDFANASQRNPRYGMVISFNIIPELDKAPIGPIMLPFSPSQFIAADSLQEIKNRIIFELEKTIKIAELAEKHPLEYDTVVKSIMKRVREENEAE